MYIQLTNRKKMDYFERINMTIIKDLISKDFEDSMLKEKISNNNLYNDMYNKKVSIEIANNIVKENEENIKIFINSYNKTVENLSRSLLFIEHMDETLIQRVYNVVDDVLYIEFDYGHIDISIKESKNNNKDDILKDLEITVIQNNSTLFHLNKNFSKGIEYKYNPQVVSLPEYKIDLNEYLKVGFKEQSSATLVQAILHENIVLPLEKFMKKEQKFGIRFLNDSPNGKIISFMFNEYREEVRKLVNEKGSEHKNAGMLNGLIKKEQFSEEFKNKYNEKIKKISENVRSVQNDTYRDQQFSFEEEKKTKSQTKKLFGFLKK